MPNGGHGGGDDDGRKRKRQQKKKVLTSPKIAISIQAAVAIGKCTVHRFAPLFSPLYLPNLKNGATRRRFAREEGGGGGGGNSEQCSVFTFQLAICTSSSKATASHLYLSVFKKEVHFGKQVFPSVQCSGSWQAPKATEARQAMGNCCC